MKLKLMDPLRCRTILRQLTKYQVQVITHAQVTDRDILGLKMPRYIPFAFWYILYVLEHYYFVLDELEKSSSTLATGTAGESRLFKHKEVKS